MIVVIWILYSIFLSRKFTYDIYEYHYWNYWNLNVPMNYLKSSKYFSRRSLIHLHFHIYIYFFYILHRKSKTEKATSRRRSALATMRSWPRWIFDRQPLVLCHLNLSFFNRCEFYRGWIYVRMVMPGGHATPFEENRGNVDFSRVYAPSPRSHEQRKHQVDFHSVFHPCVARFSSG